MNDKNIYPCGNRVLLIPLKKEDESTTKGGIILTETVESDILMGIVSEIGNEVEKLEVDSIVMYSKHSGIDFKHNFEDYVIMREPDIMMIVE